VKLEPGRNEEPLKRLSRKELRARLMEQEKARPIVLGEAEYEEWLEHTVLARMSRGEEAIDKARAALSRMAEEGGTGGAEVRLVLEELDKAVVAFQYGPLKFNIMYRPSIDGREARNVMLWPLGERRERAD
jgi:hypothetical protein